MRAFHTLERGKSTVVDAIGDFTQNPASARSWRNGNLSPCPAPADGGRESCTSIYCLKINGGPLTRFALRSTVTSTRSAILMKGMPLFIP